MRQSLYDILQVSRKADAEVIDAAYARLRQKLETSGGPDAGNDLKVLRMAYETLSDPAKRARYDQEQSGQLPQAQAVAAPVVVARPDYGRPEPRSTFLEWWSSSKVTALGTAAVMLIGFWLYQSYSRDAQMGANEKLRIEKVDGGRVENERVFVDKAMDHVSRDLEYSKDVAHRQLDMRQQQLEHSRQVENQRMEMQRRTFEQQQQRVEESRQRSVEAQKRAEEARQRSEEAQAAAAHRTRLERDRMELCRMERERYGKAISCNY